MSDLVTKVIAFENKKIDPSIISEGQIVKIVEYLVKALDSNIEGDVVELGCYVGESSKYIMKTLQEVGFKKQLYVYDSFEGLPNLSKYEEVSGWKPGTLKTTQEVFESNFKQNNLPLPVITKGWFKDIPSDRLPQKISFAFLDGDFYESIYDSLLKVYDRVVDGGYICFHDYDRPDLPGVRAAITDFLKERNIEYNVVNVCNQLGVLQKNTPSFAQAQPATVTLVTGLWDLGRDKLTEGWSRNYSHYLDKLSELLKINCNLIIYGDKELERFVSERRDTKNTQFICRSLEWFKNNEHYPLIQKIRQQESWFNQVGWLKGSTQASLEMYNPLVMSKVFLLNDAKILDKFGSTHLYWIDAGLTNTVHPGYFTHDNVLEKIHSLTKKLLFICFPYKAETEVHGFTYTELCKEANAQTDMVARAGFFGGPIERVTDFNNIYYGLLQSTLSKGLMGTEESLFTILLYKYPELFDFTKIQDNGLIGTFFENVKTNQVVIESCSNVQRLVQQSTPRIVIEEDFTNKKAGLYVLTYNSPAQFRDLIGTMNSYDNELIKNTTKYLLNNSTDLTTTTEYESLCLQYNFTHIKKDNLGICGGRQFVAEHFAETNLDYMLFFEDDMFFTDPNNKQICKCGFNRVVPNILQKATHILYKEKLDFLKLSFSEFYGDNSTQWAWYNVPQAIRQEIWPGYCTLPEQGIDLNSPRTIFKSIKTYKDVPYALGEVYYCNWPQLVTRDGSQKMFLTTKWAHPFEQTWMSFMFQETRKGNLASGVLLLSPTDHNRFAHYDHSLRKES
jgi:O-methyltransferase